MKKVILTLLSSLLLLVVACGKEQNQAQTSPGLGVEKNAFNGGCFDPRRAPAPKKPAPAKRR